MMYYSYLYDQKLWRKLFPLKKIAIDCAGLHILHFIFHSPHKLLDAAHINLGLMFKHCYMLELF